MHDFWLSCGHHLLDRDEGGGLVVTDEFLKAYLARPELAPPDDACVVERTLHAALLTNPRRPVDVSEIAAIADQDARENWTIMIAFRDLLVAHRTIEAAYLQSGARRLRHHAALVRQPDRPSDPAQPAGRMRGHLCVARRGNVLPAAAADDARGLADRRRRGNRRRYQFQFGVAAGLDAGPAGGSRHRCAQRRQFARLLGAQRPLRHGARSYRRPARTGGAGRCGGAAGSGICLPSRSRSSR